MTVKRLTFLALLFAVIHPNARLPGQTPPQALSRTTNQPITVTQLPHVSVERDWIDYTTLSVGGVLAAVGIIGIAFAIRTLRGVEQQTQITERSVSVLINSERAWVLVNNIPTIRFWGDGTFEKPETRRFVFDIVNRGRTVASVVNFKAFERYISHRDTLPDLPDYATVIPEDRDPIHGTLLAPGEIQEGIPFLLTSLNQEELYDDVMDGVVSMYVYGYITYFDFTKEERRLQFCYKFDPLTHKWNRDGPLAYNIHT